MTAKSQASGIRPSPWRIDTSAGRSRLARWEVDGVWLGLEESPAFSSWCLRLRCPAQQKEQCVSSQSKREEEGPPTSQAPAPGSGGFRGTSSLLVWPVPSGCPEREHHTYWTQSSGCGPALSWMVRWPTPARRGACRTVHCPGAFSRRAEGGRGSAKMHSKHLEGFSWRTLWSRPFLNLRGRPVWLCGSRRRSCRRDRRLPCSLCTTFRDGAVEIKSDE